LSTTEAEYVAATETCNELIWLKEFLKELRKEQEAPSLHSDIQSAIDLANNLIYHDRTKHIDVRCHFIRKLLKDGMFFTVEDTHESESNRYVDQGGHSGEAEKLISLYGSSNLRIRV